MPRPLRCSVSLNLPLARWGVNADQEPAKKGASVPPRPLPGWTARGTPQGPVNLKPAVMGMSCADAVDPSEPSPARKTL
jgi:hypothetical protein